MGETTLYEATAAIKEINAAAAEHRAEIVLEKRIVLALRHLLRVMQLLNVEWRDGKMRDVYLGVVFRYEE